MLKSLAEAATAHGITLSEDKLALFADYFEALVEASERMNLVGDVTETVVVNRHFVESIVLCSSLRERELLRPGARVLDIGAGAGFPGIPMKIMQRDIEVALLEATRKKTEFLAMLVGRLNMPDVSVLYGRAEELAHEPGLRCSFDVVVARAVAPLATLCELALPFLRVGGRLVTPKGERAHQEVREAERALHVLGGSAHVIPFPVSRPSQKLVVVAKRMETPEEYPRRTGVPAKRPL